MLVLVNSRVLAPSLVNFGISTNYLCAFDMSSMGFGAAQHHGLHVEALTLIRIAPAGCL